MFARGCSKRTTAIVTMARLLVAIIAFAGPVSKDAAASTHSQQMCGGAIQFGETLVQRNTHAWTRDGAASGTGT